MSLAERRSEVFPVKGTEIRVNTRILTPGLEPANPGTIVVIPGWGVDAGSRSAAVVGQSFADAGKQNVLVVDTKPQRFDDSTLHDESIAIANSLKINDINDVTIVGYSEGGIKAASLSIELQGSGVNVNGLVLMSPPGIYKQRESELIRKFFRISSQAASQIKETEVNSRKFLTQGLQSAGGIILSVGGEVVRTNLQYAKRIVSQLRNISAENRRYRDVTVPVVLIQGKDDLLSSPELTVPGYKGKNWRQRQEVLQDTIFSGSPYVRMITGERYGIHAMPYLRSSQIARVSLGQIKRFQREQTKQASS